MFKTSSVPKGDMPRLRYIAGYLSYIVGNYDDATAQLDYARTLGYDPIDATMLRAEIGRAHVCTPVTNAHIVCRYLLENKKKNTSSHRPKSNYQQIIQYT